MKFSKKLENDIAHKIECFGPPSEENDFSTYTRVDAIHDLMADMDDPGHYTFEHRNELRKLGIKYGVYREITQQEMDNTTVWSSSGRKCKKYDFKKCGTFYIFDTWNNLPDEV